jgi:hypothetical protein
MASSMMMIFDESYYAAHNDLYRLLPPTHIERSPRFRHARRNILWEEHVVMCRQLDIQEASRIVQVLGIRTPPPPHPSAFNFAFTLVHITR